MYIDTLTTPPVLGWVLGTIKSGPVLGGGGGGGGYKCTISNKGNYDLENKWKILLMLTLLISINKTQNILYTSHFAFIKHTMLTIIIMHM